MNKKSSIDMLRERIKTLKNENRETQKAFAERCDIDPNKLSNLMTRGKAIQYDDLEKIADACNVSIDWLVGRTEVRVVAVNDNKTVNYKSLEYGYIYNILSYLSSIGCLQIIKNESGIILRVHDEHIKQFLESLQQLSRMATTNNSVRSALGAWINNQFSYDLKLSDCCNGNHIDKYSGAFPWKYDLRSEDIAFDFSGAEWGDTSPKIIWNKVVDENKETGFTSSSYYEAIECLNDGIVGYYNTNARPYPLIDLPDDWDEFKKYPVVALEDLMKHG